MTATYFLPLFGFVEEELVRELVGEGWRTCPSTIQSHRAVTSLWRLFGSKEQFAIVVTRGGVKDTRLEAKDTKKIRGLGQGQPFRGQNLSRPRTGMFEAKAKDQGHGRKRSPEKKGLQNFFSGDLQFISVPRIFDWGRPKPQITWNDVIKIFPRRKFLWDKDIVGWKIWNRCLFARNPDFAKEEGLKLIAEKCKYLTLGTCWESLWNSNVSQTGGLGVGPPAAEGFGGLGAKP